MQKLAYEAALRTTLLRLRRHQPNWTTEQYMQSLREQLVAMVELDPNVPRGATTCIEVDFETNKVSVGFHTVKS